MTLKTEVYLHGQIDPERAFDLALTAIMVAGDRTEPNHDILRETYSKGDLPDGLREGLDAETLDWLRYKSDRIFTVPQGLPGMVGVEFDATGPIQPEDYNDEGDVTPAHDVRVSWDTGYSYSVGGLGPADLHARALVVLSRSLPEGVTLHWRNEFTDEVFAGVEEADLAAFTRSGLNASEWFTTVAMPAVRAHLGLNQP